MSSRTTSGESRSASRHALTSSHDRTEFGTLVAESPARGFIAKAQLSGERILALLS
jgi:hypothetical protein